MEFFKTVFLFVQDSLDYRLDAVVFHLQNYGFGMQAETDRYSAWDTSLDGYQLRADTRYHSIYARNNVYYILFKNPPITLRE